MKDKLRLIILILLLCQSHTSFAFDASPFNTQSAEISNGPWWTIYSESFFNNSSKFISAPYFEYRHTFFDKLRFGILNGLVYSEAGDSSAFGFNNAIFTTEYEIYDLDKYDFLRIKDLELIDHAAFFFNQFLPFAHSPLLDAQEYSFNTGIEFQRTVTKHMGLYSELGYSFNPQEGEEINHSFIYNNSLSFEIHHWIQPYIELLGRTSFNTGISNLFIAPGISLYHGKGFYSYFNPIIGLTENDPDYGFQIALTGVI